MGIWFHDGPRKRSGARRARSGLQGSGELNASFSPASGTPWHPERGGSRSLPMRTTLKWLAATAVILMAAQADAGEFLAPGPLGPRYAAPYGRSYVPPGYRRGYSAPRYYYVAQQPPDLGAAIAGALAGAALQLIPRAAEALAQRLPLLRHRVRYRRRLPPRRCRPLRRQATCSTTSRAIRAALRGKRWRRRPSIGAPATATRHCAGSCR